MKVVIPGGTGQVGVILGRALVAQGHSVVAIARGARTLPWPVVQWDGVHSGPWVEQLDGADVVINLAGRSVNCRYNAKNRREIMDSRVESTRAVGQALAAVKQPPRVWLQAGTATIYAHRFDAPNDEATGQIGGAEPGSPEKWRFSIEVARAWEAQVAACVTPATRKVVLRSAMVMSPDAGGVFDTLVKLVRKGLGGRAGNGQQYVSWIHEQDFVGAVLWLIGNAEATGVFNLAAPAPLPNALFMAALRRACGVPIGLPAGGWMLEVGAVAMRTETELLLKSRRVVPGRLLAEGFRFAFPEWPAAAEDLVERWRRQRRGGKPVAVGNKAQSPP